jgi:tetratricopeptide (TPR) repeat protein
VYALGVAASMQDDPTALSILLESLALYRSVKDKTGISETLIMMSKESNDPAQRQAYLEESLALSRERNDVMTMAGALDNLGILATGLNNLPQARVWLEESLKLQRPLGAPGFVETLRYLGKLALYEGNLMQARAYCDEALSISKNAGMTSTYLWSLDDLGYIALQEGKWEESRASFAETLRRSRSAGRVTGMLNAIQGWASLAARRNQPERAVRLFAFVQAMRKANDYTLAPNDQAIVDRDLALAKTRLDDKTFEMVSAEGHAMTLDDAIAYALEETTR